MTTNQYFPKTLIEAVTYFADSRTCVEFMKNLHWPDGNVTCPRCGSAHVKELGTRQVWKCYGCKKQFSAKVGTCFEQSPISLSKWLLALWVIMNAKNGVSSCEISRAIGVTQKTAWFMMHRLREAMANGTFKKLTEVCEADETYVGGSRSNWTKRKRATIPLTYDHKTPVIGIVERGGEVRANVLADTQIETIQGELKKNVDDGAVLYTDDSQVYNGLGHTYWHQTVNHTRKEYVRGDVSTNTIEGFFGLFKRCVRGTYIHLSPFHLDRYLQEQCLRYNMRKSNDKNRFEQVATQVIGCRLTWKELTGRVETK